jgi:hypothetical protein
VVVKKEEKPQPVKEDPPRPLEDLISYTRVTGITMQEQGQPRADLWDPSRNWWDRVRTEATYNLIPLVKDGDQDVVVRGKVTSIISTRYLVFQVELQARDPEASSSNAYPAKKAIYRLHKNTLERLVKEKVVKAEEAHRLYRVSKSYWDTLKRDKVVRVKDGVFAFRFDLVRGKVVESSDDYVVLKLDEKYCGFRDDDRQMRPVTPHLGFCYLYNGNKLIDALQQPLPDTEVQKELLSSLSADRTP